MLRDQFEEQKIRKLSKECSFKPKKLNTYQPILQVYLCFYSRGGDVVSRLLSWKESKDREKEKLKKKLEEQEDLKAPFAPELCEYNPTLSEFPKEISEDKFLLEGMFDYLQKQEKAKIKKRERVKSGIVIIKKLG